MEQSLIVQLSPAMATTIASFADEVSATLSFASPEIALRQALIQVVESTIKAAATRSKQTERAYRIAIGQFVTWLDGERGALAPAEWRPFAVRTLDGRRSVWSFKPPAAILRLVDQSALDGFRNSFAEHAAPNTIATRLFAVRTFLSVALRDGILTEEQAMNMGLRPYVTRQQRDQQPVGRRLSGEEVRELRNSVPATNKGKRDLAILDVMLFAALRREEVSRLRPRNFRLGNGRRWLILHGKGNKTRRIKVHDTLHASLTSWMDSAGLTWDDDRALFVSINKGDKIGTRQIDPNVVARVVEVHAKAANLGDVDPHDLRRTAARNAYDNGAGLVQVQIMLGHADPKTTACYIGADFKDSDTGTDHIRY